MKLSLAQNICRLRKQNGLTQERLAEALGVTFAAVSKWERGVATPDLGLMAELASLFSVSLDALSSCSKAPQRRWPGGSSICSGRNASGRPCPRRRRPCAAIPTISASCTAAAPCTSWRGWSRTGRTGFAGAEKLLSDQNEACTAALKDALGGFSVIKSFQAEKQMCRLFADSVRSLTSARCRKERIGILIQRMGILAGVTAQLGVFLIGAALALSGKGLTVGTVLLFVQLMNYVISPISVIPVCLAERKAARALIAKAASALEAAGEPEGTAQLGSLTQGIELSHLAFSYEDDKPILRDISFSFEPGKSYAVVGASGSGKSTLLHLLSASQTGYSGQILYDGQELRNIRRSSLYDLISVIQQNVFIFNATIRENITLFADFPEEAVERAIRLSGLSGLIRERGEDYLCGENGSGLSGGEKQRISIARSLLKNAQVLLVDEATAALDAQTAHQVSHAILDLSGMTRIVVTHTLEESALRRYDAILALRDGSIAEQGSFEELMERRGYFYSLYTVSQ